jgi:hypothetical protein
VATPQTDKPDQPQDRAHHRHTIYAREATGLLVIAVVLLILTLIRYWENIRWSTH